MNGPGAFILAFWGGLLSFLSPCILPLLPGYLSYISGVGVEEVQQGENWKTVLAAAVLFVLGFSIIFVALGATASFIGSLLQPYQRTLERVAGIFIIVMAFAMIGIFNIPQFYQEKRFHMGAVHRSDPHVDLRPGHAGGDGAAGRPAAVRLCLGAGHTIPAGGALRRPHVRDAVMVQAAFRGHQPAEREHFAGDGGVSCHGALGAAGHARDAMVCRPFEYWLAEAADVA